MLFYGIVHSPSKKQLVDEKNITEALGAESKEIDDEKSDKTKITEVRYTDCKGTLRENNVTISV